MTTKEYLSQIERLEFMIQNKIDEIARINNMKMMITSIGVTFKEINVKSSPRMDRLGDSVAKIVDMQIETEKMINEFIEKRKKIISQIDSIEDKNAYQILSKRYVGLKDWNLISVEMGVTFSNIMKMHGKALKDFENKFGVEYRR